MILGVSGAKLWLQRYEGKKDPMMQELWHNWNMAYDFALAAPIMASIISFFFFIGSIMLAVGAAKGRLDATVVHIHIKAIFIHIYRYNNIHLILTAEDSNIILLFYRKPMLNASVADSMCHRQYLVHLCNYRILDDAYNTTDVHDRGNTWKSRQD